MSPTWRPASGCGTCTIAAEVAAEVVTHARAIAIHANAYVDDQLYVEDDDVWARRYAEYAEVGMEVVDDLLPVVASRADQVRALRRTRGASMNLLPEF